MTYFRKEAEILQKHKEETLDHWKSSRIDIDTIPSQIEKLRLEQHVYAEKEDFDKAFEIQQQIKSLTDSLDNFKYQYPIFDPKVDLRMLIVHFDRNTTPY